MEGRIGRSTYLGYSIGIALIEIIILMYIGSQETSESLYPENQTEDILSILYLFTGIAILALLYISVLRLHDINLSGWYALLALIPIINIAGIALFFIPGTKGPNKYGEDPKAVKQSQPRLRQAKMNSIDQEISHLEKVMTTIASHIKLLDNSLNSGLITQNEFNDKVGKLIVNRKKIESRLEEINVTKLETELIQNQLDELKVLRNKGILNQKEFNEKIRNLYNKKNNHLRNTPLKSNFEMSNSDMNLILVAITIFIIIMLAMVTKN